MARFPRGTDDSPRIGDPIGQLLFAYVLETIGHLPPEREAQLSGSAPQLRALLGSEGSGWKDVVAAALELSPTLDVAILDLWFSNRDRLAGHGKTLGADEFAAQFVMEYFLGDSPIDVWEPGALEAARARIAKARSALPS